MSVVKGLSHIVSKSTSFYRELPSTVSFVEICQGAKTHVIDKNFYSVTCKELGHAFLVYGMGYQGSYNE